MMIYRDKRHRWKEALCLGMGTKKGDCQAQNCNWHVRENPSLPSHGEGCYKYILSLRIQNYFISIGTHQMPL